MQYQIQSLCYNQSYQSKFIFNSPTSSQKSSLICSSNKTSLLMSMSLIFFGLNRRLKQYNTCFIFSFPPIIEIRKIFKNCYINLQLFATLQLQFLIFQKTHRQQIMDKHTWRQVKANSGISVKPSSRWGHSCCVVNQEIIFFGGYADSNYMNDIWSFNTITMKWKQVETTGDIPSNRSNCSMNYDKQNNQIVIFGGGGPNKQRFNSISILDWESKIWIQISPKQNQSGPWERTYHSAELLYPYLIVYGGEGVADMDDLWVFSFITLSWSEVQIDKNKNRPCARRFHSSAIIGNQFFVIAGCHGKYRCLSDIYSMDFSSLLKNGNFDQLEWTERKLKGTSFLSRWGHSSAVFDKKIYIFGGRFSNDLNDLLVADFQTNTLKTIKTSSQAPQARRRHCSGFMGSSMLMFGGFNGAYFQDLYYIDVMQSKGKTQNNISSLKTKNQQLLEFTKRMQTSDFKIVSADGYQFPIFLGLIAKNFSTYVDMMSFLQQINQQFSHQQLKDCFQILYQGFGQLKVDKQYIQKYFLLLPKTLEQKLSLEKQKIHKGEKTQKQALKKVVNSNNAVVKVGKQQFQNYMITMRQEQYEDAKLQVESWTIPINRNLLMAKSKFLASLFTNSNPEFASYSLKDILKQRDNQDSSFIVYQILINFLYSDLLVLPSNISEKTLIDLAKLSDYFCLPRLKNLCEVELMGLVNQQNVTTMIRTASLINCQNLLTNCSDVWVKKMCQHRKIVDLKIQISGQKFSKKQCEKLTKMYQIVRFDLMQSNLQNQKLLQPNLKKKSQSSISMQKQNFEANVYSQ